MPSRKTTQAARTNTAKLPSISKELLEQIEKQGSMTAETILQAVHETASDLEGLGFIDKRKIATYDALCLAPVPTYDAQRIKALRERLRLSQAVLASVLNTSLSTVRKWEVGDKHPNGPSSKLLDIIERKGLEGVL